MATALRGWEGEIKFNGNRIGLIDTWNISINHATVETSTLGDYWNQYLDTCADWSGSCSGSFSLDDDVQKEIIETILTGSHQVYECIFVLKAGIKAYKGNVIVGSVSNTCARNDKITVSFNFQGTGALEIADIT